MNTTNNELIKSVYVLEVSVYKNCELDTSQVLGLYSDIYNCLKRLRQFEEDLTEWQKLEFLTEKTIRLQYPTGEYVYTAKLVNIDEF